MLAPLVAVFGALLIYGYGDWTTPYDRHESPEAVTDFRASPLPSNPAALPVLVQHDIEQLKAADLPADATRNERELAALRTERRVTLLRAYAVLRHDEAGPLLEDVVDTSTDERVRAEAVTMLGYVGYPSWRLLDELVDARDAGRDLMPPVLAIRFFYSSTGEPPVWIRDAVRELLDVAEACPRLDCRRLAAGAIARAIRLDSSSVWIEELERLAENDDHECRTQAVSAIRGGTALAHGRRCATLLARSMASEHNGEVTTAVSRASSLEPQWREPLGPILRALSQDSKRPLAVRTAAGRALRNLAKPRGDRVIADERSAPESARPDTSGIRELLRTALEDRSNTSRSTADVVKEKRRAYAVHPLRRIAREIRREVLR